jgi:hypothetical protein
MGAVADVVGDERFMSALDMDSRFALVVGMCLSGAASLLGMKIHFVQALTDRNPCEAYD